MVDLEVDGDLRGICLNESLANGKVVDVGASDEMCTVGMIRRGRSWGDYDGKCCAECPYFLAKGLIGKREMGLLRELSESISVPVERLLEALEALGSKRRAGKRR